MVGQGVFSLLHVTYHTLLQILSELFQTSPEFISMVLTKVPFWIFKILKVNF